MATESQAVLQRLAKLIRYWILVSTTAAGSGHPSSSLSAVELMTTLFYGGFFRFDLRRPDYHNNDRLIFSKGHASPLLYSLWAASGRYTENQLKTLRRFNSIFEGHPTARFPYAEAATGSLGQGLSVGVGMALNAKYLDRLPYRTYVLLGDSEMAEGSQWEAIQLAAHYQLDNLIGILDVNRLGQRGETMLGYNLTGYAKRLAAFGWHVITISDGHNPEMIATAYAAAAKVKGKPIMIIAKTVKGKGVPLIENKNGWHGKALNGAELKKALATLGPIDKKIRGTIAKPKTLKLKKRAAKKVGAPLTFTEPIATRSVYGKTLNRIFPAFPDMVVLDAEVSNSTMAEDFKAKHPKQFFEMYIAEQNMVSTALGLSRRGKTPFVSTFGAFLSRAYDQIRMSQLSDATTTFIGTHAGVSIGPDGPSQMGLADIALFRSILGSIVLHPADAVAADRLIETAGRYRGIAYVRLAKNPVPQLYKPGTRFPIGGSKVLRQSKTDTITIVAAGMTVFEALAAADQLAQKKINARIIDLYSIKPLDSTTLNAAVRATKGLIIVEDHVAAGGIGEAVMAELAGNQKPIVSLSVGKQPTSGTPEELRTFENIDARAIVTAALKMLKRK